MISTLFFSKDMFVYNFFDCCYQTPTHTHTDITDWKAACKTPGCSACIALISDRLRFEWKGKERRCLSGRSSFWTLSWWWGGLGSKGEFICHVVINKYNLSWFSGTRNSRFLDARLLFVNRDIKFSTRHTRKDQMLWKFHPKISRNEE